MFCFKHHAQLKRARMESLLSSVRCVELFEQLEVQPNERKRTIRKKRIPAIRSRVFPEYVCIEDVDKIISSVHESCSRKTSHSFWKHIYSYRELKVSGVNGKGQGLQSTGSLNLRPTTREEDQRSLPHPNTLPVEFSSWNTIRIQQQGHTNALWTAVSKSRRTSSSGQSGLYY